MTFKTRPSIYNKSAMAFNELLIGGYLRTEVLPSLTHTRSIPVVLTRLIAQTLFQSIRPTTTHPFQWGQYHSYWDSNDVYYLKPKYKNLKQELFKNKIFKLTTTQWRHLLTASITFSKSFLCHKMRAQDRPKWNTLLNIRRGTNIKLKHIIALKLYSDYDLLMSHFNTVLQGTNPELKREIAHFTRLIIEAVHLYGTHWDAHRNFKLYHAIHSYDAHPLDTLYPLPHFPFNATASMHVAKTFATRNGSVLQLNAADTKGPLVLDLSLIGGYPEERPWIVMHDRLAVDAIHTHQTQTLSKSQMEQMQFIQKILNGSYLVDRKGETLPHIQYRDMLTDYVYSKLLNTPRSKGDSQMAKMFELCMDNRRCIFMNGQNGMKLFEEDTLCGIFMKYNYKLVSMPTLKWGIGGSQYDALMSGDGRIGSERISADIGHVMPRDRRKDRIAFKATCKVNKEGRFELEVQVVQKAEDIKYVEYEYEIHIPSMSCYFVCSHSNSHCIQYDILQMDQLRQHVGSLDVNIAIRILKCFDRRNQPFPMN